VRGRDSDRASHGASDGAKGWGRARIEALIRAETRAQRDRLLLAAACAVVATSAAIGLLGLSGWFITSAALAGLAGAATAQAFNVLVPSSIIRLLAILRTVSRYGERVAGHEAALKGLAALRPRLFGDLASGRPERAMTLSSGEASARLIQDVDAIQTVFVRRSGGWGALAGAAVAVALAALAGIGPALCVAAGLAASVGGAVVLARRRLDPASRQGQISMGAYKDRLSSLQASSAELRAYGLEAWAKTEAEAAARPLDAGNIRLTSGGGWIAAWQTAAMGAAVIGVVITGQGAGAALTALAVLAAVGSMEAAQALTSHFRSAGAAREAVGRLAEVLPEPEAPHRECAPESRETFAFASLGLSLSPPMRVVLTGPTGCGKTSWVERIMGLRDWRAAEPTLGGRALHQMSQADLRRPFAYAAQEVRLMEGTVRSNLRIADPACGDAAMWAALEEADLADRMRQDPRGLDMPVRDNGASLSGGERRRLGLARAYLRAAPWLVLDEPTEGLDAACEARVIERLAARLARTGQGLVLISHRPGPRTLCAVEIAVERGGGLAVAARERAAA
jgi:ATP-binding cassette subfamily C protein CydC